MKALTLGPFAVDPDGILHPRDNQARPALHFAWRGRDCAAELIGSAVHLGSCAARMPSSATPGADRNRAFAAVAALPRRLPRGWRVRLLPDHRVRLEMEAELGSPPTATNLIAAMVRFALAMDPYLDELETEGVGRA